LLGAQGVNGAQVLAERLTIEKEEGGESLSPGRDGNPLFHSQTGEEGFAPGCAYIGAVAFVVEQDGVSDPVHVSVLGADGIVFEAQRILNLVLQFLGFWFHHNSRVTIRRRLCVERSRAVDRVMIHLPTCNPGGG